MLSAIRLEPVDRIPAATYNFHPLGTHSAEPAYAPMLEVLEEAENMGVLCKVNAEQEGGFGALFAQTSRTEGDNNITVTRVMSRKGELRTVYVKPDNQPGYNVEPLIKDDRDVARYLSLPNTPASIDMSPVRTTVEELGGTGLAYVGYDDPFYTVSRRFNFEDFTIRCVTQESLIRDLVEREFGRIKIELREMVRQAGGMEVLFYTAGPEIATPPFFSPEVFKRFITPYQRELVEIIRDAGHLSSIHCHGKVGSLLEEFAEIGADVLEPLEPPPQGDIDLEDALKRVEGSMCLMGYIQDQDFYTLTSVEMGRKVEEISRIVGDRTGFIMTPSATPFMFPPPPQFITNYLQFMRSANDS